MSDLPVLGAALNLNSFEAHRKLMLAMPRDLELQDFWSPNVLNGDWMPLMERAKTLLDGFEGRLGIHGPFIGFSVGGGDPDVRKIVKKRLRQGLEVCEALGATQMVVHSPIPPGTIIISTTSRVPVSERSKSATWPWRTP